MERIKKALESIGKLFNDQVFPLQVKVSDGKKKPIFPFKVRPANIENPLKYYRPEHNALAIITGPSSGLFVLDIDTKDAPLKAQLEWVKEKTGLEVDKMDTVIVSTPSGGLHVWFKWCEALDAKKTTLTSVGGRAGIDVRGLNGIIFCPPSELLGTWDSVRNMPAAWAFQKTSKSLLSPSYALLQLLPDRQDQDIDHARDLLSRWRDAAQASNGSKWPDYDTWLKIIMAVKSKWPNEDGLTLLQEVLPERESGEYEKKWASIEADKTGGVTWGTIIHMAKEYGVPLNIPHRISAGTTSLTEPSINLLEQTHQLSRDSFTIEGALHSPSVLVLAARSGSLKTWLMIDTFNRASKGERIFGQYTPRRPLRCLMVENDMDPATTYKYLYDLNIVNEVPSWDGKVNDLFTFIFPKYFPGKPIWDLATGDGQTILKNQVKEFKPDMVVIDTLLASTASSISKQEVAATIIGGMRNIAASCKCSIIILHHERKRMKGEDKTLDSTSDDIFGSAVLQSNVDGVMHAKAEILSESIRRMELTSSKTRACLPDWQPMYIYSKKERIAPGNDIHALRTVYNMVYEPKMTSPPIEGPVFQSYLIHALLAKTPRNLICKKTGRSIPTLLKYIKFLIDRGLIEKHGEGRGINYGLTMKGVELCRSVALTEGITKESTADENYFPGGDNG